MTVRTRRWVFASVLVLLLTLPAETMLLRALAAPTQDVAVQNWAVSLSPTSLQAAANQIQMYPFAYRKAILKQRPPFAPDAVIMDPPRVGATPEALAGLIAWAAPRIVYVSCDPPTLARDCAKLFAAGYRLTTLTGFDLFPSTPHVESVAVFDR